VKMPVREKSLSVIETEKSSTKDFIAKSEAEISELFDKWYKSKESEAERKLKKMQESSRERSRQFSRRKKARGYIRKSFWLNLSEKESKLFLEWLRKQPPEALSEFIKLNLSVEDIIKLYGQKNTDHS